ncbi:BTB/POZ domain-containing protein At5g66560-like isoform X3 [Bidens hawaiensis]|uniref:BTB/POZ domain-containing protein At5g66560-like isoform X3 n=1 Tax=Bidens hawaiensis TaxID=980011 RepID=UPI004049C67A
MAAATNPKGQAWFCSTGLPSDVVVDVDDMTFHLHKFPLMAKSKKLHELITEQEANLASQTAENETAKTMEEEERSCHVKFPDFPGGPKTFEAAAKFCYAVKIELTSSNVAPLRCAGEVLEMFEDYCEDNLVSKTERFLSQTVLRNLGDSIETLKSCEHLMPGAKNLGIVEKCIDSISTKVLAMDPALSVLASETPVNETVTLANTNRGELWIEELIFLNPQLFTRLITAMKGQNLNNEVIEICLLRYAKKHIPGITRATRKPQPSNKHSEIDQKELLETIVTNFPQQTYTRSALAVKILFGMLRTANILNASDECKATLETKIGYQFEHASLDDLLMPSYSYLSETLYDVDCVQRMLAKFLHSVDNRLAVLHIVGKLIDGYLSEIALDANLKPDKFCELAVALPEQARVYDDSLYRSVDVYIKAHPWITEADRERVSGVLDCRKLTLEACTHAAQNERLPLRAVVQVLFFEQLQLRQAIAGTLMAADIGLEDMERSPGGRQEMVERDETVVEAFSSFTGPNEEENVTWRAAVRENRVLRVGMDTMRNRVHELERECTTMKKAIEKIDKGGPAGWLTKKFGCAFKTQVCVSHKATVVETRKSRARRTHNKSS